MKKISFTDEQVRELAENQYTRRVTNYNISFTPEFKRIYCQLRKDGMSNRNIFIKCGYTPQMLGRNRMGSFARSIKGKLPEDFPDKRPLKSKSIDFDRMTDKRAMKEMQHKLLYMEQEIEFLKKIMRADKLKGHK